MLGSHTRGDHAGAEAIPAAVLKSHRSIRLRDLYASLVFGYRNQSQLRAGEKVGSADTLGSDLVHATVAKEAFLDSARLRLSWQMKPKEITMQQLASQDVLET